MSGLPLLGPTEALAHRNGRFSLSLSHTHVHARLVCLHKKNRKGWANNEINGVVRFRFLCRGRVGRRGGSSTHANVNAEHVFTRSRKTLFARTVKRDAQAGSSLVVNYFSPSAFSRRLVAGKKLVFVSFLSVESASRNTSAVHSAGEGPASSGDPSVSAGAASLYGLMTQQGPQQPRCSLPSDCSRTEGLPWFLLQEAIGGPRQAKTGNLQSRPTMARAHFPPFWAKTSRGKAGEFAGSAQEGIYYGESRPDSGNLPKRREEKAFGGSKPNTGIVLIPNREFHHSSRDVKFSLNFPLFLQARQFSVPRRKIYSSSDPPVH